MASDDDAPSRSRTASSTASGVAPPEGEAPPRRDVVLLGPRTADGEGVHVLRARDERLEAGELRNLVEGRPITGEVVKLSPRAENPKVCDVVERFEAAAPLRSKGPAQVATRAYRDNWDEIFAKRATPTKLN
jgi:hypothetical protein